MPTYTLQIFALGTYTTDIPLLEIWEDGVLDSTHSIVSSGTNISVTISYPGALPSTLSFRFNDGLAEGGRTIEIRAVQINGNHVNVNNFLSTNALTHGASATVDVPNAPFLFDSSEPALSEFTVGATQTLTAGTDSIRLFLGAGSDQIFDALAGNDTVILGTGNDKVNGNTGNDYFVAAAAMICSMAQMAMTACMGRTGTTACMAAMMMINCLEVTVTISFSAAQEMTDYSDMTAPIS